MMWEKIEVEIGEQPAKFITDIDVQSDLDDFQAIFGIGGLEILH